MLGINEKLDLNFMVNVVQNGQEKEVRFGELLSRKSIVSVYMKNNTTGCDRQTLSLAEHAAWFTEHGYNIIAVSKDTCGSHIKYAEKQGIRYTLVSDPEFKFAKAAGLMTQKKMYGKIFTSPSRSAFVIDTDGTILGVIKKIDTKNHAEELKTLINSIA